MPLTDVAPIEASIEIAAPPAAVWELVSDLSNMPRWSPQVAKTFVRGGETRRGAKMININRRGLLVWPTQSMVTEFEPERRIAFRIRDNWTIWSFTLGPTADGGTRRGPASRGTQGHLRHLREAHQRRARRGRRLQHGAPARDEPDAHPHQGRRGARGSRLSPVHSRGHSRGSEHLAAPAPQDPAVRVVLELDRLGVGQLVLAGPGGGHAPPAWVRRSRARSGVPRRARSRPDGGRRSPRAAPGAGPPPRRRTHPPRTVPPATRRTTSRRRPRCGRSRRAAPSACR